MNKTIDCKENHSYSAAWWWAIESGVKIMFKHTTLFLCRYKEKLKLLT